VRDKVDVEALELTERLRAHASKTSPTEAATT
jgi:hypothetical protein